MELMQGEIDKKVLRMGLKYVSKKLQKNSAAREECLRISAIKPIRILNALVIEASNNIKSPWQSSAVKTYGQFALWLFAKDTAYRDVFFWALYKLLKQANKLLPLVEPYVKEPKLWYPNQWVDAKEKTRQGKLSGKVALNKQSSEEQMFTPAVQNARIKKLK